MGCYAAAVNDAVTSSEDSSKNEEDGEETLTIHPLLIEHVNNFLTLLCFVLCFHFELCELFYVIWFRRLLRKSCHFFLVPTRKIRMFWCSGKCARIGGTLSRME